MTKTAIGRGVRRALFGTMLLAIGAARADELDAKALVRQVVEAVPRNSFSATLTVSGKDFAPRELRMNRKYLDGAHASYLEVVAPPELAGIRFLFIERVDKPNEQYIKVKFSRSPVQVQEEIRTQPFLGSTFYVSDLVLPDIDAYDYTYVGRDVIAGRSVMLVAMLPKNPADHVYAKTILALDPKDKLIMRREFFDRKGAKVKVWTIDRAEQIDGIWTLSGQKMEDLSDGSWSRLDVGEVAYNVDLSDDLFTPKYLSH